MVRQALLVIAGPTASGKSAAAIAVARAYGGEIISADSMQVYRGMDIGTAKPSPEERELVAHHLIDAVDPDQPYDISQYQAAAVAAIDDIARRGKLPILAGGSGLYIRSVIDQFELPPRDESGRIRRELWRRAEEAGEGTLRNELAEKDTAAAESITPGNVRRLIRALEVIALTGRPYSEYSSKWDSYDSPYELEIVGIHRERWDLYARINSRVDSMIAAGLVDEVASLCRRGYRQALTAKQGLGYKELVDVIDGKIDLDEAVSLIKKSTRNFAKRQFTWFKRDPRVHWVDCTGKDSHEASTAVLEHLGACERMAAVVSVI